MKINTGLGVQVHIQVHVQIQVRVKLFCDPPRGFAYGLRRYLGGQKSQTKNSDGMDPAGGDGRPGAPGRVFGGTQVPGSPNRYGQTRYIWFV